MGLGTRFGRRSAPLRPASDVSGHPTSWTAESGCLGSEAVSLDALIADPGSIRSVCPAGGRRGHHFGYFRAEREDFFSRWRLDLVESRVGNGSHWAVCTIHCACNSSPKSEKLSHRPETIQKGRRPSAKRQNWAPDHREKIVDIFHAGDRDARSVRRTHDARPSIDVMDAPGRKYCRWRAGKDRHKKFYDWKVVITAIRGQCQDMEDRERFVGAIHLTYGMKRGGAISSLAKLIRAVKAREKTVS